MRCRRLPGAIFLLLLLLPGFGPVRLSAGFPGVNLRIVSIDIDPAEPMIFQLITLIITIENTGSDASGPCELELRWSCCESVRKEVESIDGGGIVRLKLEKFLFFVEAGSYDLYASIDPDNEVTETNENDNDYSITIEVKLESERLVLPASNWFDEPSIPIPWEENSLMLIGRKEVDGEYYRDEEGRLLRELDAKPWDSANILRNKMPYPAFTIKVNGLEVEIEDKSRDDDGEIVEWVFDFGDGTVETYTKDNPPPSTGKIKHTYSPPSTPYTINGTPAAKYVITLTVRDNESAEAYLKRTVYVGEAGGRKLDKDSQPIPYFTYTLGKGWDYDFAGSEESKVKFNEWRWNISSKTMIPPPGNMPLYQRFFSGSKIGEERFRLADIYIVNLTVKNGSITASIERNVEIDSIWLPTQRKNACGTTSLAYVLRYWGVDVMPDDVDGKIRDASVVVMGTDPLAIADYAQMQGLNAQIYNNANLNFVRSLIDRGIPVMMNIIVDAKSTDVMDGPGHWVVAISYGMVDGEPYVGFYEPNWGQIAIPERFIEKYWKEVSLKGIHLWTRLCIAIAPYQYGLPPGDIEDIRDKLAMAYIVFQFMEGLDDFTEGSPLEGIVKLGGIAAIALGSWDTLLIDVGLSYVPGLDLLGEILGNVAGSLLMTAGEILNDVAGLLDFKTLFTDPEEWLKNLGNLFLDILQGIGDFFRSIGEAIADFFRAIGKFFKKLGCKLFGWGCPKEVVKWKHALSLDPCGEAVIFVNGFAREKPVGYIFTEPPADSIEIFLYGRRLGEDEWKYYVASGGVALNSSYILMGFLGYSNATDPGGYLNLTKKAKDAGMYLGGVDGISNYSLGFIPGTNFDNCNALYNATILWLMKNIEDTSIKLMSVDPCLYTRTFLYSPLKAYSRDMIIGYVFYNEAPGTVPLYRFYNPKTEDFYASTNPEPEEGYMLTGLVGYIYPPDMPKPEGTIELWSFWNKKSKDHMESIDPQAEGKEGYELLGLIGYVYESYRPCTIPLWRYCVRYIVKE